MVGLKFGLLGPTVIVGEEGEIAVRGTLRRRLLIRLLLSANLPVSPDRLIEDLWDGTAPPSAESTLKSHVSLLRRSLGPERLTHRDGGYVLALDPDEFDVTLFEQDASGGRSLLRAGEFDRAADVLAKALDHWRGPAITDVADAVWAKPEAVRLDELRAMVIEGRLEARLAMGHSQEVIADAEMAVAEHPLREGPWASLITALYRCGRQSEALRSYQRLRQVLAEELGINPSPQLVALEGAILRQDPAIGPSLLLGHRAPDRRSHNLPRELTSFIPRPTELADIAALLEKSALVTLTGAGGTGKTRLAVRAAWSAADSYDQVWLCELAPLQSGGQLVRDLAASMGCAEQPGVDLLRTVEQHLADGQSLVVLDNCEHIVGPVATLVTQLLRSVASLRVLATSRAPLGVEGEVTYRVPSLSIPDRDVILTVDDLLAYESVTLFAERAASHRPGYRLGPDDCRAATTICVRLDGIPLALELAASRTRSMSINDIASRLDDSFEILSGGPRSASARQQTLKACIDWSYDLLTPEERLALIRLAVFVGGFDLAAAEHVVATGGQASSIVDTVSSLVDQSLLQVHANGQSARYRMLETVRQYALGRLSEVGSEEETDARAAHSAYYLQLVEEAAPHFVDGDHLAWRIRLDAEHENLRTAFTTLAAQSSSDDALRFGAAVSRWWNTRGFYGQEVELLETALDRPDRLVPPLVRGRALSAAGYLLFRRGETNKAERRLDEALGIASAEASSALRADALKTMAWIAERRGHHDEAVQLAGQAVDAAIDSGERYLIARAHDVRGATLQHSDATGARIEYAEALRHSRSAKDAMAQVTALNNLAILELEVGDYRAAERCFGEARLIAEDIRDEALLPFIDYGIGVTAVVDSNMRVAENALAEAWHGARLTGQRSLVAYALLGLGAVRVATDRVESGALLLGASSALFEELGEQPERVEADMFQKAVETTRQHLGTAADRTLAAGRLLPSTDVVRLAAAGFAPQTKVQTSLYEESDMMHSPQESQPPRNYAIEGTP
jgi:predicted ATPase/DNA-binding SARP family transcriptional activator